MNRRLRKKNRWVPILLCCAILMTLVAPFVSNVFGRESEVRITLEGAVIDRFSIQENEKVLLTADPSGFDAEQYQWQILLDSSLALWVNIADKTSETCEISVAVLDTLLDEHNCAYLRCAVTGEEGPIYSDSICALVLPAPEPEQENTAEDQFREIVEDPVQMRSIANAFNDANAVVMSGGGGEEDEDEDNYVTITIKYLSPGTSSGMESQFTPYVATVEKGLPFHQSVVSPTIMGFAPFLDVNKNGTKDDGERDATSVPLDYDAVTESVVFHVVYESIPVTYAARFYFQNVADDLYTERAGLYRVGKANSGDVINDDMIRPAASETVGFTSLYHVPESVAADGSTVFECYYDRNYYLIRFDLGGGYGVDPIYARYESTFLVPTPIQAGYTFNGWELVSIDGTDIGSWSGPLPDGVTTSSVPTTVPACNLVYRAKWNAGTADYTTAYWIKRGNGTYEYLDSTTTHDAESGSEVDYGDTIRADFTICGLDFHTHNHDSNDPPNYCFHNCTHVCLKCYTQQSLPVCTSDSFKDTATLYRRSAFDEMRQNYFDPSKAAYVGPPIDGTIYKYLRSGLLSFNKFNYFYYGGTWYYLGKDSDYADVHLSGAISDPKKGETPTSKEAEKYYRSGHHVHSDSCASCGKIEHKSHDATCLLRSYYEYDLASTVAANTHEIDNGDGTFTVETNKVAGDGSTVVNVYYKPKTYTLRFYYAAQEANGTYEVIGGSTYPFGHLDLATEDDIELLDHEFNYTKNNIPNINVGAVTGRPQMNDRGNGRAYTTGTEYSASSSRTYYYFEFSAEYGQDISNLWPIDVFHSATRLSKNSPPLNGYTGNKAFVSAWNGEYYVRYSVMNSSASGGNETIKGKQVVLDSSLLFDMQNAPDDVKNKRLVSFLCFWENGTENADVTWNIPNLFVYKIWVPVKEGETGTVNYNGTSYKLFDSYPTCDNSSKNDEKPYAENQTEPSIPGYKAAARVGREATDADLVGIPDVGDYNEKYVIDFFYEPLKYPMGVYNYGKLVGTNDTVSYGSKYAYVVEESEQLAEGFTPVYPASLEPDAYTFQGWYSTENFIPGTEIDLENGTMPNHGLMVYSKWSLVQHTVNYFASYDDLLLYQSTPASQWGEAEDDAHWMKTLSVPHGKDITTPVTDPDPDNPDPFKGWFYLDENGDKVRLESQNMPIHQDLNVFAERHTSKTVPYTIHYTYENPETHVVTKIADDTTGEAFLNSTCTFTAKAGDQLYSGYQTSHFPKARSHSINMKTGVNEYTFEYVTVTGTPQYTVRYLDKLNRPIPISGSSPVENYSDVIRNASSAVAKERFMAIADMVPDSFFKKLVLQAEYNGTNWVVLPENNVITFYYLKNSGVALYGVHYMLEKVGATDAQRTDYAIDGSGGYEQTGTMIEGVGNISAGSASVQPQEFPGFELVTSPAPKVVYSNGSVASAVYSGGEYQVPIDANGTEMYVFYRRKSYPYHIRYYLYNTDAPVPGSSAFDSGTDVWRLGSTVTATARTFTGYTVVKKETDPLPYEKSVTINVEESGSDLKNVITFYYTPNQYIAEYIAVPEEAGRLSNTIEVKNGSETFAGSTPTPKANCVFEGWYLNEACTIPVSGSAVATVNSDNTLVPSIANMTPSTRYRFYAKFVKQAGNLTITRSGAETDQVFVYKVQNTTTEAVYYVTVTGNGSVTIHDLPMGTYTVTQQKDWSWRYDEHDADVPYKTVVHDDTVTTVTFSAAAQTDRWVNGNTAPVPNQRGS